MSFTLTGECRDALLFRFRRLATVGTVDNIENTRRHGLISNRMLCVMLRNLPCIKDMRGYEQSAALAAVTDYLIDVGMLRPADFTEVLEAAGVKMTAPRSWLKILAIAPQTTQPRQSEFGATCT